MIDIGSKTPKKYKFLLETENGNYTLENAIIEWADMKIAFKRSKEFGGVFTEFLINSCTFIEQGKDVLKEIYEQKGIRGEANLRVFYLSRTTFEYKEFPTAYELDFNTYKYIKKSKSTNAVQIKALPIGILAKLNKRKNVNIDLTRTESVGNYNLIDYPDLRKNITFPEINAYQIGDWEIPSAQNYDVGGEKLVSVPTELILSDFNEAQTVIYNGDIAINNTDYHFFNQSEQDRTITIISNFVVKMRKINLGGSIAFKFAVINSNGSIAFEETLYTFTIINNGNIRYVHHEKIDYSLSTGQSMIYYFSTDVSSTPKAEIYFYISIGRTIRVIEEFVSSPATTVEGLPICEAFERSLQLILDKQYPLYTEFFGREDVIRNIAGDYYASENQLRFAHILNGLSIRGLILSDTDNAVTSNFLKLFKSVKCLYNIGLGIEELDGYYKIRIEELAHWYEDSEGLDLSGRINEHEIEEDALSKVAFAQVKSGFKSYEYEAINGRGEYNTTNERTSDVPNDNIFDNISQVRGDTKGITTLLEKPIDEYGSEDVKGDNDLFIIKTQKNGVEWDAETDENIEVLNNTSFYKNGSLNLYFTPTRNLLRHNYILATSFYLRADGKLTFQTAKTLQTLQTTDGADDITENQDIPASQLGNPKWKPNLLKVECDFYETDYETLKINQKKYVTLSPTKKGWIWDIKYEPTKNKAKIELIERM